MTKKSIVTVAALALIGVAACTDVVVEPESTVTGANVFNDPSSYKAFLAKLYVGLTVTGQEGPAGRGDIQGIDEGFSSYLRQFWQLQELPTDEAIIGWGDPGLPELNTQLWATSNVFVAAMFSRIYFQVAMANEFLRETSDAKLSARNVSTALRNEIQTYRAEARYLRALSYWHGVDLYGNIPLVTEEFVIGATPPDQATRAEVFNFIVNELNEIRSQLPAAPQYGRAGQGAVNMLLAKLYMNSEAYGLGARYSDARVALEAIISSNRYRLDDRYQDIFLADNHTSPEIIFPVPQDGQNTRTWGGMTFLVHATVGGNMNASDWGINGGWWGIRMKQQTSMLFTAGDARGSTLFTNGQQQVVLDVGNFNHGFGAPKFRNRTSSGGSGSDVEFPDVDFPMFRLGDVYLMYAEAVLRGGGGSRATALGYVNDLRRRAFGGNAGDITDSQLTLNFLLEERARELFFEAHRRTDLVRFNNFTTNGVWAFKGGVPAGRTTEAYRNLYPIPANDLLSNPNLTQNPGYN